MNNPVLDLGNKSSGYRSLPVLVGNEGLNSWNANVDFWVLQRQHTSSNIQWMDEILHHLRSLVSTDSPVNTNKQRFQPWFHSGANGFCNHPQLCLNPPRLPSHRWVHCMLEGSAQESFGIFGEFYVTPARYATMTGRGRDNTMYGQDRFIDAARRSNMTRATALVIACVCVCVCVRVCVCWCMWERVWCVWTCGLVDLWTCGCVCVCVFVCLFVCLIWSSFRLLF